MFEGNLCPAWPLDVVNAQPADEVLAKADERLARRRPGHRLRLSLFELAQECAELNGGQPATSFTLTFPKKVFSGSVDFSKTLKEAGLVPSAVLVVS